MRIARINTCVRIWLHRIDVAGFKSKSCKNLTAITLLFTRNKNYQNETNQNINLSHGF